MKMIYPLEKSSQYSSGRRPGLAHSLVGVTAASAPQSRDNRREKPSKAFLLLSETVELSPNS